MGYQGNKPAGEAIPKHFAIGGRRCLTAFLNLGANLFGFAEGRK